MEQGAQLQTRDGRRCGNAYVDEIYFDKNIEELIAVCYTECGNSFRCLRDELRTNFYPPKYVFKLNEAREKFKPKAKQKDRYVIEIRDHIDAGFVFDTKYIAESDLYTGSPGVIYSREHGWGREKATEWLQIRCDHLNEFDQSRR